MRLQMSFQQLMSDIRLRAEITLEAANPFVLLADVPPQIPLMDIGCRTLCAFVRLQAAVSQQMRIEQVLPRESDRTEVTLERAIRIVDLQMSHQETLLAETFTAIFAVVDFLGIVHFHVHLEGIFDCKPCRTVDTLEGSNFSVQVLMFRQSHLFAERFPAQRTNEFLFFEESNLVMFQRFAGFKPVIANPTFECLGRIVEHSFPGVRLFDVLLESVCGRELLCASTAQVCLTSHLFHLGKL